MNVAAKETGGGWTAGERLARIEERLEHVALQNDVTKLKVWILGGVLSAAAVASAIAATVVQAFF